MFSAITDVPRAPYLALLRRFLFPAVLEHLALLFTRALLHFGHILYSGVVGILQHADRQQQQQLLLLLISSSNNSMSSSAAYTSH